MLKPRSQTKRLVRGRRFRVTECDTTGLRVIAHHASVGELVAEVRDISFHGLCALVHSPPDIHQEIYAGDRLDHLAVRLDGRHLYQGDGLVRRVSHEGNVTTLGIETSAPGIDIATLHRHTTRTSVAERWTQAHADAHAGNVSDALKLWTWMLRDYFESTREFLQREENELAASDERTRETTIAELIERVAPDVFAHLEDARVALDGIVGDASDEQHARNRIFCQRHLSPLFDLSPFVRRARRKPLGYAGDYELMNMLYRDHDEGDTLLARVINIYATQEIAARANCNRLDYLGEKIRAELARRTNKGERLRIASIGCGPAREIASLLELSPELGTSLEVVLVDQEPLAMRYCELTLGPLARSTGARLHFCEDSIRRLFAGRRLPAVLGRCGMIYSAGLFDYLNARTFTALLEALHNSVVPGGVLIVGNVASHNPSRWMQEYFLEWFLHHRSPDDLLQLSASLTAESTSCTVESEPSGVNLFLVLRR